MFFSECGQSSNNNLLTGREVNADCLVNISDITYLIACLYKGAGPEVG